LASGAANAVGGVVSGVRNILPFAEGGIVTRPTIALVGEDGAEAIVPLTKPNRAGEIMQSIAPVMPYLPVPEMSMAAVPTFEKNEPSISPLEKLSTVNNYSSTHSNASGGTVYFSPNITIQGGGDNASMQQAVTNALNEGFEKWFNDYQRNSSRVEIA